MNKQVASFDLAWLEKPHLNIILKALNQDSCETRIVGGAIRNAMLGLALTDIDLATTCCPETIMAYLEPYNFKILPTGLAHGTLTIITPEDKFEITRLRKDVKTDGRHATVSFNADWAADAQRRDFTINALYLDKNGYIYDYVDGIADLNTRSIKFIGDAAKRIQEDYLRILRFFRFYAHYSVGRPDRTAILNCAAYKAGLRRISAERIWAEFKKILNAPDPRQALLWMRQSNVLSTILPESEKWGIDAIHNLIQAEKYFNWSTEDKYLLRLEAIIPKNLDTVNQIATRLKLTNKEKYHLQNWAKLDIEKNAKQLNRLLYENTKKAISDNLKLLIAKNLQKKQIHNGLYVKLLTQLSNATSPVFPIQTGDLMQVKTLKGPAIGKALAELKQSWLESDCTKTKNELLNIFVNKHRL